MITHLTILCPKRDSLIFGQMCIFTILGLDICVGPFPLFINSCCFVNKMGWREGQIHQRLELEVKTCPSPSQTTSKCPSLHCWTLCLWCLILETEVDRLTHSEYKPINECCLFVFHYAKIQRSLFFPPFMSLINGRETLFCCRFSSPFG